MTAPVRSEAICQSDPQPRRWSKPEYYRMGELGFFDGQKVELLEGEIILNDWVHEPHPRPWSKDEFYLMGDLGWFQGQRAELIGGEIMVMSPQKAAHATTVDRVAEVLRNLTGPGYHVRMQLPLDLGARGEPEPDVAIVTGSRDDYRTAHPRRAELVVEVSETTLPFDRNAKASLYAASGALADYWIVNIPGQQVEVFRDPVPDLAQTHGHRYGTRIILAPPDTASLLTLPKIVVRIADLF